MYALVFFFGIILGVFPSLFGASFDCLTQDRNPPLKMYFGVDMPRKLLIEEFRKTRICLLEEMLCKQP